MTYLFTAHLKADDTYIQLKKDLEYLDLKVGPNKENATSFFFILFSVYSALLLLPSNIGFPVSFFTCLSFVVCFALYCYGVISMSLNTHFIFLIHPVLNNMLV